MLPRLAESYPYYQHEEIGYNYRMSNICAGIGRGQMTVLEEHIAHHQYTLPSLQGELLAGVEESYCMKIHLPGSIATIG